MQQWEYCRADFSTIVFYTDLGPVEREMGSHERAVAYLGLEGWEAFALAANSHSVYFKRPKGS
jgi:hypothetical protein